MASSDDGFFALPTEIHTEIFTIACSPSCFGGSSDYAAFLTGISLSLVSKYVRAASAPARHRVVILYGWQQLLAFEGLISNPHTSSRVRYLTLICDELPRDSSVSFLSSSKAGAYEIMLGVIARLLRAVETDLYELELGFQAIEYVSDPLAFLSPLYFPNLGKMFYACPPSNSLPWAMNGRSFSTAIISPCLEELTVVLNDSVLDRDGFEADGLPFTEPTPGSHTARIGLDRMASVRLDLDCMPKNSFDSELRMGNFPSLTTLNLYASSPAGALAVLYMSEVTWSVGSTLIIGSGTKCKAKTSSSSITPWPYNFDSVKDEESIWPPKGLRTIILRPKRRWCEKWKSLRDVTKRRRELESELPEIFVLKPGERYS
ncbi:hypothetical protein BDP27DRAFT_1421124 [Rhodocollybia butyracea]|uniref:Uncharacterized protein n=1 Tax=Rhodocollybia butyracea TaxID=206335 RepID=A0A9P5PU32_9AGAR|nr:hypothetical protein BDP27DRAFT_1421124 [Rhodocollybia butyracea]